MEFKKLPKEHWALLARNSNIAVFGEQMDPKDERIDFTYVALEDDKMVGFVSCQERDADSLYIQYGGLVKPKQGQGFGSEGFPNLLAMIASEYQRVGLLVENTNMPMLKMALGAGFLVIGMRNFKGKVLLEMGKEF